MTCCKLFGSFGCGENCRRKPFDVSQYEAICFGEMAKHSIETLTRISKFVCEHSDKLIFGAGDTNQIKPIGYKGTQKYLDECTNIIFPN